jgi:hypothetical protein
VRDKRLNTQKLLLTKWTAIKSAAKQKQFFSQPGDSTQVAHRSD